MVAFRSLAWCVTWMCMIGCTSAPASPEQNAAAVFTWSRDGGFAGFCDTLQISATGDATAASCKVSASQTRKLSSDDLARLNAWRQAYGAVSITSTDGGVADGMTLKLKMNGTGRGQPTEAQQAELLDWAQRVFATTKG
jgi:hypothetical protein